MEKEQSFQTGPTNRIGAELKQSAKGVWYIGSVRVNADSIEEMDSLIESAVNRLVTKTAQLNSERKSHY